MMHRQRRRLNANQFYRRPIARPTDRGSQRNLTDLRALRLLHEYLSDLRAHARRASIAARSYRPHSRDAREKRAPDPKTVAHLDSCLSCLSCMTTCAVNVDYVHLIDRARAHIEASFRRPMVERVTRALLARVLPHPRAFGAAMALGRVARPLWPLLPQRWRTMLDMIPPRVAPDVLAPQSFRAEGAVRKRVALLAGCAQQALNGDINAATIRLLRRHGCEVVIAVGSGCCGSLNLHMGREGEARAFARQNICAWEKVRAGGLDALIINASGCGTTVKDYGHLFAREPSMARPAEQIAALARDVSELLWAIGLRKPSVGVPPYRVAYHDPCSMQHVQK